jgi:hypothetical protein
MLDRAGHPVKWLDLVETVTCVMWAGAGGRLSGSPSAVNGVQPVVRSFTYESGTAPTAGSGETGSIAWERGHGFQLPF